MGLGLLDAISVGRRLDALEKQMDALVGLLSELVAIERARDARLDSARGHRGKQRRDTIPA